MKLKKKIRQELPILFADNDHVPAPTYCTFLNCLTFWTVRRAKDKNQIAGCRIYGIEITEEDVYNYFTDPKFSKQVPSTIEFIAVDYSMWKSMLSFNFDGPTIMDCDSPEKFKETLIRLTDFVRLYHITLLNVRKKVFELRTPQ